MKPLDHTPAWTAIRTSLLVVAAIHVVMLLQQFESVAFSPIGLLARSPGILVRWLAWSLVAPGIALMARDLAARRLPWLRTAGWVLAGGIVSVVSYSVLEETLKVLLLGGPFFGSFGETGKNLLWGWDLPIVGLTLSISLALEHQRHSRRREVQASRLETELAVSTLGMLQAQIQPHFLFNTLHVIAALVRSDPEAAERTIARLSTLLRRSMHGADTPEVSLTSELDLLMDYVEIVHLRYRDRLRVDLDVHPDAADARVPGLLLQPLVENAVRHGIGQTYDGGTIRVAIATGRERLTVRVADTGPGFAGDRDEMLRKGSGLANLLRRLELLYPGDFRMELLRDAGGGALVAIDIPFRTAQRAVP